MPPKQPQAGKWVKCLEGYKAYIPDPLPPDIRWTTRLTQALSRADHLVGRLAGEAGSLPNPHVFIRPFIRREAVLSSRIEGTQSTLGEILAVEAGAVVDRSPEDLKEVGNYVTALEYGIKRLKRLPLSLRLIREIHEKLMKGVRGEVSTPGKFRTMQNWIGPPGCTLNEATFVPPPPHELMNCMGALEKFLHASDLPPLVQIALAHYQFETIHPFVDGNGRVGRLLISLFLVERQLLPTPLLYLSAFFESDRNKYYDGLRAVSESGDWEAWLTYFLSGVAQQAEDGLLRAERINKLISDWRKKVQSSSLKSAPMLIDLLVSNPYITANKASKELKIAFTTAQRAIERLEKMKILTKIGKKKRDKTYCARALLRILEEPSTIR